MLSRIIKILQWPALLFGSATAIYVALFGAWNGRYPDELEFVVDLKPGGITSPEFRVGMKGHYEIRLEAEHNLPLDDLEVLLGIQPALINQSVEPVVDIEWTLTSGDSVVASGASRNEKGGGVGDRAFRTIGRFDGLPKIPYVLELNILGDGSALAPANPQIAVGLDSEDLVDLIIIPRFKTRMITVFVVIIVTLFLAFVLIFRRRNTGNNPADDSPPGAH